MQKYNEICVALDIEASGLDPQKDEIIEIAMVKFQGKKTLDKWDTLINPQCEVSYHVLSITGISQSELDVAEDFDNIKSRIKKFIGNYPIVGHNIDFDLNFLAQKGVKLDNPRYDSWHMSTILLPNLLAYGLESLASRFNLAHKETHRALADTEACRDLFLFLIDKIYQMDINLFSEINSFLQKSDWDIKRIFGNIVTAEAQKPRKDAKEKIATAPKKTGQAETQKEAKTQKEEEKKVSKKIPEVPLKLENLKEIFQNKKITDFLTDELNFSTCDIKTIFKVSDYLDKQSKLLLESKSSPIVYLIPAVYYAITSGEKVVISSTKDHKGIEKEFNILKEIIPFDFKGTFIDSPYNYLCFWRFSKFKKRRNFSPLELRVLLKVLVWINQTKTGHRQELALLKEEYNVWQEVNADLDFCPNQNCPQKEKCFWQKIKKDTQKADLILTNSKFLIFDFESSLDIFKNYKNLILLDCHLLEDMTTYQLGESVTFSKVDNLLDRIDNFLDNLENSDQNVKELKENIKGLKGIFDIFWGIWGIFLNEVKQKEKNIQFYVRILDFIKTGNRWIRVENETKKIVCLLEDFKNNLNNLNKKNVNVTEDLNLFNWSEKSNIKLSISSNILGFVGKIDKLKNNLQTMILYPKRQEIYWGVAEEDSLGVFAAPEAVNSFLNNFFKPKKCVILASFSLKTKGNFDFIKNTLGVSLDFNSFKIKVPEEGKKQPVIYIFKNSIQNSNLGFWKSVNETLINFLLANSGNALVYFTSLSNIRESYKDVAKEVEKEKNSILAQGFTSSAVKILESLEECSLKERIILFCMDNVLELLYSLKIELKFDYLLVTKLPFDSISNPVFITRKEKITSGFSNYIVPRAIIRFKKVLHYFEKISKSEKKNIFVLDDRIVKEDYGKDFLKSLSDYKIEYIDINDIHKNMPMP